VLYLLIKKNWHFQGQTMQMMYDVIAREIKAMQLDSHPLDYLNFYCLGNREPFKTDFLSSSNLPPDNGETVIIQIFSEFDTLLKEGINKLAIDRF